MGIMQALIGAAKAAGFKLKNSVRLRGAANPTMTIASLGGSATTQKAAFSTWLKTGTTLETQIFSGYDGANYVVVYWNGMSNGLLRVSNQANTLDVRTTPLLRDPTAWYHLVVILDGTAAAGSRCKIYINGVQQPTSLNTDSATAYTWGGAYLHRMSGNVAGAAPFFDGYFADTKLTIGQNNVIGDFGEFNASGVWVPKAYTGTYGNNGFHLKYEDASTPTSLGLDSSGNGKNWTPTNINQSPTTGVTYDSMVDTPTNNYATLNPLDLGQNMTPSSGNLNVSQSIAGGGRGIKATQYFPRTGKWYCESKVGGLPPSAYIGLYRSTFSVQTNTGTGYLLYTANTGVMVSDIGATGSFSAAASVGDMLGLAFDMDAGTFQMFKNGVSLGTAAAVLNNADWALTSVLNATSAIWEFNFGQRPFTYTPPTGFKALCTENLQPPVAPTASGTFTGTANADGPFVWIGGVPTTLTINGNAVTFGTHADKIAGGFKVRSAAAGYNVAGANTWVATFGSPSTRNAFAQPQPAQANP